MAQISRRPFLIMTSALGVSALFGSTSAFAAGNSKHIKPFLGSYSYVGGKKEEEARDKAIEESISNMGLFKSMARNTLLLANQIPQSLSFATEKKGGILVVKADKEAFKAPTNGDPVDVIVVTGDEMSMHYDIVEAHIDQIFEGDDKGRTNRFKHKDEKLVMHVTVHATQLAKNLVYKLTYEKA